MKTHIFEFQAEVCRAFGHSRRLQILDLLKTGELSVGDITKALGAPKANVSQHLSVMRLRGLLKARRNGVNIHYRIANEKLARACGLMQDALGQILEGDQHYRNEAHGAKKEPGLDGAGGGFALPPGPSAHPSS